MENDTARAIHEASLDLLENPGVRLEHETICGGVLRAGGQAGGAAQVVRLPREMVAEKLALCPPSVVLTDRTGTETALTSSSPPAYWSCPGMSLWRRGEHRPFTSRDMAGMARLLDKLDHVHAVFGMSLDDIRPEVRDVAGLLAIARNTRKHIRVLCFTPAGADCLVELRRAVADHPWFSIGFTAHGPLRWTRLALEIFARTAGHGIPTTVNGEPMAGVSGPVTLTGSAAVGNAEILAGIVVNQVLEPGRPCVYNLGLAHVFDMRTAIAVTGAPENALFAQLSGLMGTFYGLPSASWVSTEAMCPDAQAALEKTFGFLAHTQSGVSLIWGVGQLESELTFSPAQAVIDQEAISFVNRYQRGADASLSSLATKVVREVGIAESFLEHPHTLDHFRSELFEPAILCRRRRAQWEDDGGHRLDEVAEQRADELMQLPVDNGLSDEQEAALERVAAEFMRPGQ